MEQMIRSLFATRSRRLVSAIVIAHLTSVLLFVLRAFDAGNTRYYFLLWNALLGVVPIGLVVWLRRRLRVSSWLAWQNVLLTALWVSFLPNSFYLVSDLIHVHQTGEVSVLYDIVLFMSFILNGFVGGYMSVYLVHYELMRRIRRREAHVLIAGVLFLSSLAIYIGRVLRWNSWDIFLHPAGVLFDVSHQVTDPITPNIFAATIGFFLLIGSGYFVVWNIAVALRMTK